MENFNNEKFNIDYGKTLIMKNFNAVAYGNFTLRNFIAVAK
jgi:hypothetical protein